MVLHVLNISVLLSTNAHCHVSSQVFHDELSSMRLWVSMHVSDHSGFHYRQFLLKELITELSQTPASTITTCSPQHRSSTVPSNSPNHHSHVQANGELSGTEAVAEEERQLSFTTVLQLFRQEMELCSDLIQSFPGHETLWSHRWSHTAEHKTFVILQCLIVRLLLKIEKQKHSTDSTVNVHTMKP